MKIENVEVFGFRASLRGMRNPTNSWDKSDSESPNPGTPMGWPYCGWIIMAPERMKVGPDDMKLACKLIKGGPEHRKFLRQIQVWFDITVPRYVWTELDTYKVATVRNSCSTMHKLGSVDLTQDDFELPIPKDTLKYLNIHGQNFRNAKLLKDTKRMGRIRREYKNILPEGFLQKATFSMNYETAMGIFFQRRNHRLPEWREENEGSICHMIKNLPYMTTFIEARG